MAGNGGIIGPTNTVQAIGRSLKVVHRGYTNRGLPKVPSGKKVVG